MVFISLSSADAQQTVPARPGTDAHGDPLPPDAVARIGTTRLRHASWISSLAFSSDDKHISSATIWFDVGVWNARTGQMIAFRSSRQSPGLFRAAVSPDGSLFAGRTDNHDLGVQDAVSGKIIHRFKSEKECCEGLAFSRDNHWLASADKEGNTFLWDLKAGTRAHHFKTKPRETFDEFCHAFTPDGTIFIQARPDDITFWDVQTGKEIRRVDSKKEREWPHAVAASPYGQFIAVRIAYGSVNIWEIKTGQFVRRVADHWNEVGPVFSPDGKQVVTRRKTGEIDFWEVETGKLARTFKTPAEEYPTSFAFSSDGKRLAVGGSDHAIHLWDLATDKEVPTVANRLGGTPSVRFLADGKTLVAHRRYEADFWNSTINEELSFWDLNGNFLRQASLKKQEKRVHERAHACVLSRDAGTVAYGTGPNFGVGFDPTPNRYLKSSIRLCDVATGKELVKVDNVPCQIHDLTFTADDRFLLVNAFNAGPNPDDYHRVDALQLWKRKSPTSLEKVADIPKLSSLSGYGVSPDSRWVAVTSKSGYRFHDFETGKLIRSFPNAAGSIVAVSPSGRMLVSRDTDDARTGKEVLVWEQATGKTICKLDCKPGQTDWAPLVVSPDGRFIAGCLDREVIALWDVFAGKQIAKFEGHRGEISSLCFSADGRFLVSAASDTTVLIWDWQKKPPKASEAARLSAERLEQLRQDLQARDAQRAYQAIAVLLQSPAQAIELLRAKSRQVDTIDKQQFKQWIAQLDSDSYQVREKAMKALIDSGELAEAALRQALSTPLSLEALGRVAKVLDNLPCAAPHATTLATTRSLELLELINTPESQKLIEEFVRAADDPVRQREAEQTLNRVKRKLLSGRPVSAAPTGIMSANQLIIQKRRTALVSAARRWKSPCVNSCRSRLLSR
jgi:WD40 repeat protein